MRPVKTIFDRDGYCFEQIWRSEDIAIYAQTRPGALEPSAFEVVRLVRRSAHPLDKDQTDVEGYPGVSEWGHNGFTCVGYGRAREKALSLL